MSISEAVIALADGNPGAVMACMAAIKNADAVDPDSALGGLGIICQLDEHHIYGSNIWTLYKDVCGHQIRGDGLEDARFAAIFRAIQFEYLDKDTLREALNENPRANASGRIDSDALLQAVKERLPRFAAGVKS